MKTAVFFDDLLLSKQASNFDLFFRRERHNKIDIYYVSQSYFHRQKTKIRDNSKIKVLFEQTITDIIHLFHDIAGWDINLQDWIQLCRKAWENDYEYLQKDTFGDI